MNTVSNVICLLRDTNSKNDKLQILKDNKDVPNLLKTFQYAYDPKRTYGIRKIPSVSINLSGEYEPLDIVFDLLDDFANRKYTGNAAIEKLTECLNRLCFGEQDILKCIIKGDMRCGASDSSIRKVFGKDSISEWPTMLCEKRNEKNMAKMVYPAMAQIKYDGMRVNFVVDQSISSPVSACSRSGKPIETFGIFDDAILEMANDRSVVFDGEFIIYNDDGTLMPRKESNGIVNKAMKGTAEPETLKNLTFVVWDKIPLEYFKIDEFIVPYQHRYNDLISINHKNSSTNLNQIEFAETVLVNNEEEAIDFANNAMNERGLEGIILKNSFSIWENKRSKGQIKIKAEEEIDLEITGFIPGTGKYEGMIGSISSRTSDGLIEVNVGTGLNDEDRGMDPVEIIGKIMAVKYNEVISKSNGGLDSLFLPVFVEVRDDKIIADKHPKRRNNNVS